MAQTKLDPSSFDRTDIVHYQNEPDMLPSDIIFQRLHYLACFQNGPAVREEHLGLDVSYAQLLGDVIYQKQKLIQAFSEETLLKLGADEEVAFVILARGYEFVVALFAVLAIGGIAVPTSTPET